MTKVTGALPFDPDNIFAGAVRIMYATPGDGTTPADSVAVPADLSSIINLSYPYLPKTNWKDAGSTKENPSYTRAFDTEGLEIQESKATLADEITEITRTLEVSLAEFRTDILRIIENAPAPADIAAATGKSAQKVLKIGDFSSVERKRWCFIGQRPKTPTNQVTETDGRTRGPFVACVLYSASISADDASIEMGKGELAAAGVTVQGYPESGLAADVAAGAWFLETGGQTLT